SSLTVATVVTGRRAAGEIARPESRGREMYSSRSWNGVAILHVYHGRFPPAPVAAPAGARSAPLLFALARAVLVRVLVGELLEHRVVGLEVGLPVAVRCPIDPPSYPLLGLRPHHCQGDREREAAELPDTPRDLPGEALVQVGMETSGDDELAEERRTDVAVHRDEHDPEEGLEDHRRELQHEPHGICVLVRRRVDADEHVYEEVVHEGEVHA